MSCNPENTVADINSYVEWQTYPRDIRLAESKRYLQIKTTYKHNNTY